MLSTSSTSLVNKLPNWWAPPSAPACSGLAARLVRSSHYVRYAASLMGDAQLVADVAVPSIEAMYDLTTGPWSEGATGLDASLVVPMPLGDDPDAALAKFLKEMNVTDPQPVAKLTVSISTVPQETTVVVLDSRGKV